MNKQLKDGGVPASVEPNPMSKTQELAPLGTPFNGKRTEPTFNPCFVLLGLHILAPKQEEYCQMKRCQKHRINHPDKMNETKLELIKSWDIKGRGDNCVKMSTWKCPRCGKRVRRKLDSWRERDLF